MERGRNGDADLAIHDLTQAVSINPRDSGAYVNRAVAHMERNRPADLNIARNELTHAIELEPDSPIAYFNRGLVYSVLENWDRSTNDLLRAHELRPDDPKFNDTLCWQLGLQRQPEKALPYCKLALATEPDGPARDSRGLVYAVMGRYQEAIEDFTVFLAWVDRSAKETAGALTVPPAWPGSTTWRLGETPSTPKPFDNFGSDQSLLQMTPAETVAILFKALRLD